MIMTTMKTTTTTSTTTTTTTTTTITTDPDFLSLFFDRLTDQEIHIFCDLKVFIYVKKKICSLVYDKKCSFLKG